MAALLLDTTPHMSASVPNFSKFLGFSVSIILLAGPLLQDSNVLFPSLVTSVLVIRNSEFSVLPEQPEKKKSTDP